MAVHPNPKNLTLDILRRLSKPRPGQPREPKGLKRSRGFVLPEAVRRAVRRRSRQCCERCGVWCAPSSGEIHHRRNKSQGIDNRLSNLVYLCQTCHEWIGHSPKLAHAEGFHLEHGEAPEGAELEYGGPEVEEYGRRRMVLADDGSVGPADGVAS